MKPFSKCEQCGEKHHIVLLEHKKENSVVIGFIQCPSCQHKTVCSVTTPHIRSLQKRIRTIRNQYGKAKRLKKAERLLAEYEKMNAQIKILMQPLIDQENTRINH
ncbi:MULTISPECIES: hypothetical protein [Bacillus]|uniref:hypothetical protein n=1 Tax=Bacillus TaxID=1386 RepID=UPI000933FAA8|nr:hypothetical protein [Bacillus subtilis]MBL3636817.1 hypothetical protein [Alkalicoccobacillus gibsonii]MCY8984371.1 hypothetical protein [Bacillus subtilis]MDR4183383.1 hypothetical protein [Bacillus subtilis]NMP48072.1 hypothetical protein [Bacillus subtilis]RXM08413.1 hypothetical protein ETL41_01140 [Bacillus subtilis]